MKVMKFWWLASGMLGGLLVCNGCGRSASCHKASTLSDQGNPFCKHPVGLTFPVDCDTSAPQSKQATSGRVKPCVAATVPKGPLHCVCSDRIAFSSKQAHHQHLFLGSRCAQTVPCELGDWMPGGLVTSAGEVGRLDEPEGGV